MAQGGAERPTMEIRVYVDTLMIPGQQSQLVGLIERPLPYLPGDKIKRTSVRGHKRVIDEALERLKNPDAFEFSSPAHHEYVSARQTGSSFRRRSKWRPAA